MHRCQRAEQDVGGDTLQVIIQVADGAHAVVDIVRGIGSVGDSQVTACQERNVVSGGLGEGDEFLFHVSSFSLTGLRAAGFHVYGFMKAARGGCRVLSSSCLPWFSFDGSHRVIMVSECHLFFMFFCHVCMPSGYALSRVFVCVLHPYGFPDVEHEGVAGNISTSAVVIVKHLKNRNGVASPDRAP